ncbi:MAG: LytR/AlgR family response regulator transcription factor [Maribacter stanieri]
MLRVFIVDDEEAAHEGMELLLSAHSDVQIVAQATTVEEAKGLLLQCQPDLVFLDIEMPQSQGFGLVDFLGEQTQVIFVTAHAEYAARAFDVKALDYLLKPVRASRLSESLDRVRSLFTSNNLLFSTVSLVLRDQRKEMVVDIDHVAAIQGQGDYTRFILVDSPALLVSYSIGYYKKELPEALFFQVNRSLIVNLSQVKSLEVITRDSALLHFKELEEPLELKRTSITKLRAAINVYVSKS